MKEVVINKQLSMIQKHNNFDEDKLAVIKYGLESIYILVTKTIIIFSICFLLGLVKETLVFLLCYNIIRTTSFGLHATKSWICLLSSALIFIILPYICTIIKIPFYLKLIIGIILVFFIFKNAPADTYKRPIINKKRRLFFKICSTILAIIMVTFSLITKNQFISNCLIFSIILQSFIISPTVYKLFKLPYNNYKKYI